MAIVYGVIKCDYCGEEIGPAFGSGRQFEPDVCGKSECEQWARDEERGRQEEAADRAREDGYERYR